MPSSVLRSPRAVKVNVEIMRAFVRLRHLLATHRDLWDKIESLEEKYDAKFKIVFDANRALMDQEDELAKKPPIGFWHYADEKPDGTGGAGARRKQPSGLQRGGRPNQSVPRP